MTSAARGWLPDTALSDSLTTNEETMIEFTNQTVGKASPRIPQARGSGADTTTGRYRAVRAELAIGALPAAVIRLAEGVERLTNAVATLTAETRTSRSRRG